ncbi:MAG: hypothetical protein LAO55_16090, partial [Acidobacteriia bacterium]|nr:hypothetical protein [Terriglobia bacterium]
TRTATVNLNAAVAVSSVNCTPGTVNAPGSSACTVTLTGAAPSGGLLVTLSSNNANATVPANVTVGAGATTAGFTATVLSVITNQSALITATSGGQSQSFTLNLVAPAQLSSVSCAPGVLGTGQTTTCTVTLSAFPTGTVTVNLSSSSGLLPVPASVSISGSTTKTFTATAGTISSNSSATITASYSGQTRTATVNLNAAVVVSSVNCTPGTVNAPGSSACTVTLTGAAPSGGLLVTLSSNNANATVPANVTVGAGATTAGFTATVLSVITNQSALITATSGGQSQSFTLNLVAPSGPAQLSGLGCNPGTLGTGQAATCTVTLTGVPTGTVTVNLSSSSGLLPVPASVSVSESTTKTFTVTAGTITSDSSATITSTYNGFTRTTIINLLASDGAGPQVSSITCSPLSLKIFEAATCEVTMNRPVNAPTYLSLSSSDTILQTQAGVAISSGLAKASFVVTAGAASTDRVVTLTASSLGSYARASLTLLRPPGPVLSVPPYLGTTVSSPVTFGAFAADPSDLSVSLSASALPPGATFSSNGTFNWTPGEDQIGLHTIIISATNSANVATLKRVTIGVIPSAPSVRSIVNAASLTGGDVCSPGSWANILGAGFTLQAPASVIVDPLETSLAGVQVLVNGSPAPLLYASDSSIIFQCPQVPPGSPLQLTVSTETGALTTPVSMTMQRATPGIFTMDASGTGQGSVVVAGTDQPAAPDGRPARKGESLSIYGNGFGEVDGGVPAGSPAPLDRQLRVKYPVKAVLGGIEVIPSSAGLAPGQYGVFVINVQVPQAVAAGSAVPLYLTVTLDNGTLLTTNQVTVAIADPSAAQ